MMKKKQSKKEKIIASWGKIKSEDFYFPLIENYFLKKEKKRNLQEINNRIIDDIDLNNLFTFIDRTNSKVGQQFYFDKLLNINSDKDKTQKQEECISYLLDHKEEMTNIQLILSKLNNKNAYYISDLFLSEIPSEPKLFWVIKLLFTMSLTTIVLTFFYDFLFLLLLPLLFINMAIHYWNKKTIYTYMYSIPQLIILLECASRIVKMKIPFSTNKDEITKAIKEISSFKKQMFVFKIEASLNTSELYAIIQLFLEYIKIILPWEPLIVFNVLNKLKNKRHKIKEVFDFIGEVDSLISIANLRSGTPFYCIPSISVKNETAEFIDIYHPLIENCVFNSLSINNGKSILLTGSNMSGKTTFIRTIAINTLLAQTINTCFARSFKIYPIKIHTAIHMSDDLLASKSYYLQEVLLIKSMIDEANTNEANFYLLDELFKGTNTRERIAAGKAVLSYLARDKNIVIVSTHDIELTELLLDKYELYHFTEVVENKNINFDYKIKKGKLTTFNAIRILEINNYPSEIIQDAKSIVDYRK